VKSSKTFQNFAHAACPNFGAASNWVAGLDTAHGWNTTDFVRTLGDVNGDGKVDAVGFGQAGVFVAVSNGASFGTVSKWLQGFDLAHGWTVSGFVRTVGDVDGDGKADAVGFGQNGVFVGLSTGTAFNAPTQWVAALGSAQGWTVSGTVRTVGDVNGDGKADLVGFGSDGVWVATSTGTAFNAPTKWLAGLDAAHGWNTTQFVRTVGDVNGDGKADAVGFGNDGVFVALSNGTTFDAVSKWSTSFDLSHGWTVSGYVRTVGDVNGDGRADIVGFGADGVYLALSMGDTFSLPSKRTADFGAGWTVSNSVRTAGDVNGGGKADLVGFDGDGVYVATSQ
jgi:FG-GAP-like repeat